LLVADNFLNNNRYELSSHTIISATLLFNLAFVACARY
jgi:hypothetical protein